MAFVYFFVPFIKVAEAGKLRRFPTRREDVVAEEIGAVFSGYIAGVAEPASRNAVHVVVAR